MAEPRIEKRTRQFENANKLWRLNFIYFFFLPSESATSVSDHSLSCELSVWSYEKGF